jgi:hypothetical protein
VGVRIAPLDAIIDAVTAWRTALACGMLALFGTPGKAQTPTPQPTALEREEFLFIVNPPPASKGVVVVAWIPEPMQRYCLGRTLEQCIAIDYCLRTTDRDVRQYRNDSQPRSDFDRLSIKARIRARISVKRSADGDEFDIVEVLNVPVL